MAEKKGKLEADVDALYMLPLAEFTAARNTLAGQLKKSGRADEANFVKALGKPSISAWAVNQLYWKHRQEFDRLIATGERFRQAQTSRVAQKGADMRVALDQRRDVLSHISNLATELLRDAGHNPAPDTMLRITATLEAMSVYAAISDGPRPGRLSNDVDPPGFESLASLIPPAGLAEPAPGTRSRESARAATSDTRKLGETRQARVAAAKASLQAAKSSLSEARTNAQNLEAAQKKTQAEAKNAEKRRREAEELFEKAKAISDDAARHAQVVAADLKLAAKAAEDAKRAVDKASKELEKSFREST